MTGSKFLRVGFLLIVMTVSDLGGASSGRLRGVGFAMGFSTGVVHGFHDLINCFWHALVHPVDSANALGHALVNYDQTYAVVSRIVADTYRDSRLWTEHRWGEFTGATLVEVASYFTSYGAAGKLLGSSAKVATISGQGAGWALRTTRHLTAKIQSVAVRHTFIAGAGTELATLVRKLESMNCREFMIALEWAPTSVPEQKVPPGRSLPDEPSIQIALFNDREFFSRNLI